MRTKQKKPQILWLSDIHFIDPHKNGVMKDVVEQYIECLLRNISLYKYTHVVITGDICFSSQTEEYHAFYRYLLKEIIGDWHKTKLRIIIVPGNHDINHKKINQDKNKELYKNLSLLSYSERKKLISASSKNGKIDEKNKLSIINKNYRSFFKEYISQIISDLVFDNKLEQWYYLESQGLYGIVYDKEYNLIFNCLNSSWFAFGEDNMIGLKINELKRELNKENVENSLAYLQQFLNIKEYGKLVFGSLHSQKDILLELHKRGRIQESFVITMSHHPLSWMDYEIQYNHSLNESNFDKIIKLSDLYLCGHQHIKHYTPSKYRGIVNILESPELMDFKMYFLDAEDFIKQNKRFGFNILTLNHETSSVLINQFYTKDTDYYERADYTFANKIQEIGIDTKSNQLLENHSKIISRKSLLGQFRSLLEIKDYLQKNYNSEFYENNLVKISREKYKSFVSTFIEDKLFDIDWVNVIGKSSTAECVFTIINIDPFDYTELLQIFYHEIKELIDKLIININFNSLNNYFELKILFFDFWVFAMFSKNENWINDRNYQQNIELLEGFFVKLKYRLFSNSNDYKNIALTFDVINFETYKQYFVQK